MQKHAENGRGYAMKAQAFAMIPHIKGTTIELECLPLTLCTNCKWSWCVNPNDETPFYVCRHPMLCNMRMSHKGNWFCGYGELKDGEQE